MSEDIDNDFSPYSCHIVTFTIVPHGAQIDFSHRIDDAPSINTNWCQDYGSSKTGALVCALLEAIAVQQWDYAEKILASIQKEES